MSKNEMIDKMIFKIRDDFYAKGEYEDLPETTTANDEVADFYFDNELFKDVRMKLEDLIYTAEFHFERQGFYYGFKVAMEMFEKEVNINE